MQSTDVARSGRLACLGLLLLSMAGYGGAPAVRDQGADDGAEALAPAEARSRFSEAVRLIEQDRDDEAAVLLELLAETYPALPGPWVNLGLVHQRAGRPEAAEGAYQAALERRPDHVVALTQLGVLFRGQGRFDEARALYERALAADPDYAPAHLNYGVLLDLYLQHAEEALAHYERYEALTATAVPDAERPDVTKWIAELKRRIESNEITARAE